MSSVLPGCGALSSEFSRGRPRDDTELPRRRLDRELRNSDETELLFECDERFGVPGGVRALLSCNMRASWVPMVVERRLVGDGGGVDRGRATGDFGSFPGTARFFPSLDAPSVCR